MHLIFSKTLLEILLIEGGRIALITDKKMKASHVPGTLDFDARCVSEGSLESVDSGYLEES